MKFSRVWAMPNHRTFRIPPIKALLEDYGVGNGWADPFAGESMLAQYRNDFSDSNVDSLDWIPSLPELKGAIVDPPYSTGQLAEHYKKAKGKCSFEDCQNIYSRTYDLLAPKIKQGGLLITCGWHSNGAGKGRGFELIELLAVHHGGARHDTLVTVEKKL